MFSLLVHIRQLIPVCTSSYKQLSVHFILLKNRITLIKQNVAKSLKDLLYQKRQRHEGLLVIHAMPSVVTQLDLGAGSVLHNLPLTT